MEEVEENEGERNVFNHGWHGDILRKFISKFGSHVALRSRLSTVPEIAAKLCMNDE